jgi:EEF1A lysine methyltransferase 1
MPSRDQSDSDTDDLELSSTTLLALQEFMNEQESHTQKFTALKESSETQFDKLSMADFTEDWQLSQFWYDEATCLELATEVLSQTSPTASIACISAPSCFLSLNVF